MNDTALFEATVPVLRHYVERIDALLSTLSEADRPVLERSLAPHAFSAAEHLRTALGFVHRTVLPLLGRDVPDAGPVPLTVTGLRELADRTLASLADLDPRDFDGAAARRVRHVAGEAALDQDATTFATRFALPNFLFHLVTAFAILRAAGIDVGKADFDGQHAYAPGFHF